MVLPRRRPILEPADRDLGNRPLRAVAGGSAANRLDICILDPARDLNRTQ